MSKKRRRVKVKPKKTSRTKRPANMSVDKWQIALRREFGREQDFKLKNIGDEPVFSEYIVTNPASGGAYRVAIRGIQSGDNYCSCPDFSINSLGTCKHVEFVLAKLERKREGKKAFREGFLPPYSEVYLRYGAKRDVCFKAGHECPAKVKAYASQFFDERGVLEPSAYARFHHFMKKAPCNGHDLRCYGDALQFVASVRDDAQRRKRTASAFPKGDADPRFANLIKGNLYPYQRSGALFAATAGRCFIADDMGLGKTIQAIAAVEILAQTAGVQRILVVSPTSVKHQWKQEIERFTDRAVEVVEGLLARRALAYKTDSFYKITNYDVIHNDADLIRAWAPDVIILDEAQRIKNWKTRRARCVKGLDSEYAIVLTGTPLENRLEELHSIVEFVDRFHLGPLFRFLAEHQHVDENGRVVGYRNLSQISKTLEPVLIRRTRDEVLKELPDRVDNHFFVEMTDEQWQHHEENKSTVARIVAKWKLFGFLSEKDQRGLMIALQNMRMSCNSTFLLDKQTDYGVKADELVFLLEDLFEDPAIKAVVFSQWVGTHQLIIDRLAARKWEHAFYHGSLSTRKRNELIQRFKEDPACRILLSTDSGGVGLNLQHASVVVNMDQPWNPAVLEQRIGRVHRLGQKRNVRVTHFVAQGTIEHGMLDVLKFKKSVFAGVLDGGEDEVFLGGTKLKKFMETVENVTGGIPQAMPKQEEAREAAEVVADDATLAEEKASTADAKLAPHDPWQDLLAAGMDFIGKLGQALQEPASRDGSPELPAVPSSLVAQDEKTGQPYVRLPMPEPATIKKIADAVSVFAGMLQTQASRTDKPPE